MPVEYLTPAAGKRSLEVLRILAERWQHRALSIPDLLIAATAETARLAVLHVDKDFELIAEITGQETPSLGRRSRCRRITQNPAGPRSHMSPASSEVQTTTRVRSPRNRSRANSSGSPDRA
jgi:hypothetical protein